MKMSCSIISIMLRLINVIQYNGDGENELSLVENECDFAGDGNS